MQRIVVGVHDSSSSRSALRWAIDRARQAGAELEVVTAVPLPIALLSPVSPAVCFPDRMQISRTARLWLRNLLQSEFGEDEAGAIRTHVTVGHPVEVLRVLSAGADLLVLGRSGRRRFASVGRSCLRRVTCPVMIIDECHPALG